MTTRIVVVGAGISGLAAAHRLCRLRPDASITVLEAAPRVGGKIRSSAFAGIDGVDEGADAFLARVPHALALARELGLGNDLTSPAVASANVWWNGLHPIPQGLLLGIPADLDQLARTRLLTWPGKLRAALEPILPATGIAQDSVGLLIRRRFGRQVHERLVDPLVGSIYAADTDRFSLSGVPQIRDLAATHRSLLLGARQLRRQAARTVAQATPGDAASPIFASPTAGMGALTGALLSAVSARGVDVRLDAAVADIVPDGHGRHRWRIVGASGDDHPADAVVLASPARATSSLIAAISPDSAAALASFEHAGVVLLTLELAAADWPDALRSSSGYLVPKPVQRWVTAVSFATAKWAHWHNTDRDGFLLRVSLGRDGRDLTDQSDEALLGAAIDEVGGHLGLALQPRSHRISRWPQAFPQYRPGHAGTVRALEAALATDAPGVFVTGASYHGIGIPACIHSATTVADALTGFLATVRH